MGNLWSVAYAAAAFVLLFLVVPIVIVGVLFVWAAIKDGREDRELRERLGR